MHTRRWIAPLWVAWIACCAPIVGAPAAPAPQASAQDPVADRLARLEPLILDFVESCDRGVIAAGRPLDAEETAWARRIGVDHPERVRILVDDRFPEPADPAFAAAISDIGPAHPVAETTGYGVQLTSRVAHSRRILRHELTHVAQIERMGLAAFMHAYLFELLTSGYRHSSLEAEALANERA